MKITTEKKWMLFQIMVSKKLIDNGFNQNHFEMASSLDMSFEEDYMHSDLEDWEDMMDADIEEFKEDAPELFSEIH